MVKHFVKMSLQLYQVDYKSFLLDFKSLPTDENNVAEAGEQLISLFVTSLKFSFNLSVSPNCCS